MNRSLLIDFIILSIVFVAFIAAMLFLPKPTHQVINCSLAEISPDFTAEMRKECRTIRGTKL